MDKRTKDIVVATVAVGTAVVFVYYALAGRSPKVNLDIYTVLGTVTADECARLAGNKGQVLLMIPDMGPNKSPSVEAEVKAFEQALRKQKGMGAVSERVEATAMTMMATGGGVPVEKFFQGLEKHKGVAILTLFFAFPDLRDAELENFKKYGVKTIVISSPRSNYKKFLEQGAIQLVISPRQDTPPVTTQPPRTVRERFDQDFVILASDAAR